MTRNRYLLLPLLLVVSPLLLNAQASKPKPVRKPVVRISSAQRAKIQKKIAKMAAYDQAEEAMEFYANSRTGTITTRDGAVSPNRSLDPARYIPAIESIRLMPRIDSSSRRVSPPDGDRIGYRAARSEPEATAGAALGSWTNLGPANQGGRTRALLIDPSNPNNMYAGGVDGGVWKSTDAGANWSTNTDLVLANLAVVTLAFQPNNPTVLYAGTGEGFGDSRIRGAGIFKSVDSGTTWTQLASTRNSDFYYVNKILVSPLDTQRVWAATRTGIWRSLDGGATWSNSLLPNSASGFVGCTDMAMQVASAPSHLFASCGGVYGQGTVWRSVDSNTGTWSSVLSLAGQGRSSIAIAPSNESIVYVMSSQRNEGGGPGIYGLHGVYRSLSGGAAGTFTTQRAGNTAFVNTADKINKLLLSNPFVID